MSDDGLDLVFRDARTHTAWRDAPVDDALLRRVYDLAKMGPTSANMSPLRIVFVRSKERLKPALDAGNVDKTMKAPVTAILGMDVRFYEQLPKLYPHADARSWFAHLPENVLEYVALRNSSLQGAYFMLAARSLGLDCGPMSGFDNARVDAAFFAGTAVKSNFLCNIGHGDASKLHPRSPRLSYEEACKVPRRADGAAGDGPGLLAQRHDPLSSRSAEVAEVHPRGVRGHQRARRRTVIGFLAIYFRPRCG